jgi:hypothetical protein
MNNWQVKITRLDGDIDEFDLGSDELTARERFRDIRRDHERGKNDPLTVGPLLLIGDTGYERRTIVHVALVAPAERLGTE